MFIHLIRRWCHLEPQDVVSECAKLSFDPFEVGLTGFSRISSVQKDKSTSHFVTYHAESTDTKILLQCLKVFNCICIYLDSTQCESKTCLTLSVINDQNLKPAIMEDMLTTKVVNNAEQDASAMFWSPSMVVGLMTPPGLTPSSSAADLSMRHRDGSRSNSALGQPLIRASGSFSSHFSSNEKNRHSSEASSLRRRHQSGLSSAFARVFGSKDSSKMEWTERA